MLSLISDKDVTENKRRYIYITFKNEYFKYC